MLLTLGKPVLKWRIGGVMTARLSAASLETVQVPVFAASGGVPVNPTSYTVAMAFETGVTAPASGDWKAGTWDVNDIGDYLAGCLVGTGGAATLAPGTYYVWVRITTLTETVVQPAGELAVY